MEVFEGRPISAERRLPREMRVYDYLDNLGISYTRADHEHADTMEACAAIEKALDVKICKNLFLCNRQKTEFYLLLMPGGKPFKTKEIPTQVGCARLSFATPDAMLEYLDIEPGAVSVMGLMNDKDHTVRLLIDEDVLRDEFIGCHPCVNTSTIKIRTKDMTDNYLRAVGHVPTLVRLIGE